MKGIDLSLKFAEFLDKSHARNYDESVNGNYLILYPTVYDFFIPYKSKDGEVPKLDITFETKEKLVKEFINTGGNISETLKLQTLPASHLTQEQLKHKELADILISGPLSLPMLKIEQFFFISFTI